MEVLFKNRTKYTEKEYNIFLKSYKEEYAMSNNLYIIYYLVFFGFCLVLAIMSKEILLIIALSIGLIIYIWYKFIRPGRKIKKEKKSNKIQKEHVNTFEFYKNFFDVKNPEGKQRVFYLNLYRVVEEKRFFYIYISRDYAFIVSKAGFIDSTSYEFGNFIKKKARLKYKSRI